MKLADFLKIVRASNQLNHFYHFTDEANLPSIRKSGLKSTSELRRLKLFDNVRTGGDDASLNSDSATGTDQYVCLCFTRNHPMSFRAAERGIHPVYLSIDPDVINLPGVMITDAPSNQTGVIKQVAESALDSLHLDPIYRWIDWTKHPEAREQRVIAEKYEILIPKEIALSRIVGGL